MRQTSTSRGTAARQRLQSGRRKNTASSINSKKGLNPPVRSQESSDSLADAQAAQIEEEPNFSFSFDFEMREQALQAESQFETVMEIDHQYPNAFHLVRANKVQQTDRDGGFTAENTKRAQEWTLGARAVHKLEKRAHEYVDKLTAGVAGVGEAMVSAGLPDQQVLD